MQADDDDYVAPPFDLERMKKALASEVIEVPQGLTREELCEFILKHARLAVLKESESEYNDNIRP